MHGIVLGVLACMIAVLGFQTEQFILALLAAALSFAGLLRSSFVRSMSGMGICVLAGFLTAFAFAVSPSPFTFIAPIERSKPLQATFDRHPANQSGFSDASSEQAIRSGDHCFHDGDQFTVRGQVAGQMLSTPDRLVKEVWIITSKEPICIVEAPRPGATSHSHYAIRFQVLWGSVKTGVPIELIGTLSTGNFNRYFLETSAIQVARSRVMESDAT